MEKQTSFTYSKPVEVVGSKLTHMLIYGSTAYVKSFLTSAFPHQTRSPMKTSFLHHPSNMILVGDLSFLTVTKSLSIALSIKLFSVIHVKGIFSVINPMQWG